MSITVNTNMSSIIAQRSLFKSTNKMNTALERLSTGLRINSSKDDAAGSAISSKLEYKMRSYNVAKDNAQMGQSMLGTANGTLSNINSMLQRMRDLTEQAANGTYGNDERKAMQSEIDALTEEIYRIKNTTEFNGKKIFGEEERNYTKATISMSEINSVEDLEKVSKSQVIGISSADELKKMSSIINEACADGNTNISKNKVFALTSNIELDQVEDGENNWTSIKEFRGTVEGNGYTISNITINKSTEIYQGFIGVSSNAIIKDLNINNAKISSKGVTGILTGTCNNATVISNCNINGEITTTDVYTGGLAGSISGESIIENCSSSGFITGGSREVGGLVGTTFNSTIKDCYSSCNIETNGERIGGLVGLNYRGSKIENCYSTGSITANNWNVGGLVGFNTTDNGYGKSEIINCKTTSKIFNSSSSRIGALVGQSPASTGIISNCQYNPNINQGLNAVGQGLDNPTEEQVKAVDNLKIDKNTNKNSISVKTNLQVGIDSSKNSVMTVDTGFDLGSMSISVESDSSARQSLDAIDELMGKVIEKQTEIGAVQNRIESTMDFQDTQIQALTSSNSVIKDADIAEESANYIKNQILQQVTSSLLATANQNPSVALQLL